ncbi:hypothetical protein [Methanosarcina sp.]|nr:hypothetical protein [Methanosarcina sp.]MDY9924826.1 hypothetical protein [Methanosarcina sp.]
MTKHEVIITEEEFKKGIEKVKKGGFEVFMKISLHIDAFSIH